VIQKTPASYRPFGLGFHSVVDWLLVAVGLAGPLTLGYADQAWPAVYTYAAVGIGVLLNSITDYPGGLARLLPMRWHQAIEWTSPAPFIAGPWLLFPEAAEMRWLLTAIGAGVLLNTALTRKARPTPAPSAG
jgi:hypothetical protein